MRQTALKKLLGVIEYIALTVFIIAIAGCSKENSPEPEPTPEPVTLVEYVKAHPVTYSVISDTPQSIGDLYEKYSSLISTAKKMTGVDVRNILNLYLVSKTSIADPEQLRISKAILDIETTDALGDPVTISGAVYYNPLSTSFKDLIIDNHFTIGSDEECPSCEGMTNVISFVSAVPDIMMVSSDYIGFGVSKSRVHPYILKDVTAVNQLDFFKAAVLYLDSKGYGFTSVSDGLNTYAEGASQGGSVSLDVHRKLESDETLMNLSGFKGSYCCDGPYDPWATFSYYIDTDKLEMPCVIPMSILGLYEGGYESLNKIDINEFVSDTLRKIQIFEKVKSKEYTTAQISKFMTDACGSNKTTDILSAEVLNPNSNLYLTMKAVLQDNSLADGSWKPEKLAVFHHSENDPIVPYANFESIEKAFPEGSYVESPYSLDLPEHSAECALFYATFLLDYWKVDEVFGGE